MPVPHHPLASLEDGGSSLHFLLDKGINQIFGLAVFVNGQNDFNLSTFADP